MNKEDQRALLNQLAQLKAEISGLIAKLDSANAAKKANFSIKEEKWKKLQELIRNIKSIKADKDMASDSSEKLRALRDTQNKKVHGLIAEIRELDKEKKAFMDKCNIKADPSEIKAKIDRLELSIETSAMLYEHEKKVMEQIKKLKKTYLQMSKLVSMQQKIGEVSYNIKEERAKADQAHKKIVVMSGDNSYAEFIALSKNIAIAQKAYDDIKKECASSRDAAFAVNDLLLNKLKEAAGIRKKLDEQRKIAKKERDSMTRKMLDKKAEAVEEKLRKGIELTTEDLLVYQKDADD